MVSRSEVQNIGEKSAQEAFNKLNDRVINVAEQTAFDALESCDVARIKAFTKTALRSALNSLIVSNLENVLGCYESSEDARVLVARTPKSLAIIGAVVA